jgi:hypothetical protein
MNWTLFKSSANGQLIHEKMFKSLAIREMQIKSTLSSLLVLVRIAMIKKAKNNKCW